MSFSDVGDDFVNAIGLVGALVVAGAAYTAVDELYLKQDWYQLKDITCGQTEYVVQVDDRPKSVSLHDTFRIISKNDQILVSPEFNHDEYVASSDAQLCQTFGL